MLGTALTAIVILIILSLPFTLPMGALLFGIKWMIRDEKNIRNGTNEEKATAFAIGLTIWINKIGGNKYRLYH